MTARRNSNAASTWTRTPYSHEFRSWWPRYPKRCLVCGHRRRNRRHM